MTASERIDRYLDRFRLRLAQLNFARGAAAAAGAALVITVVAVAIADRNGFPDGFMLGARLLLLAGIAGIVIGLIVQPNRRLGAKDGVNAIEARSPEFDGRLVTYAGMTDDAGPFRELLAEDAHRIAERHAPEAEVPQKAFSLPLAGAALAVVALLALGIAGPGNFGYGVRDLWLGWAIPGVVPPQSIAVTPGDSGIRAGGTLRVRAVPNGFSPGDALVHARFGDDDWQEVSMAGRDEAFEFTFFSVREPLEYYVSAAGVRSPAYRVEVVDLPAIERLTNEYDWPEWTGRENETQDPGGDVRAIADTQVEVVIEASEALTPGVLVVDEREIPLQIDERSGRATFTVEADGEYHVAAVVGGERIRLSEDYFVTVIEDEVPDVEFSKPGRDWSASPIEEVTVQVSGRDDFKVETLTLNYSVNGGEWATVDLPAGEAENDPEHVFMLEALVEGDSDTPLVPGDLLSYYAVATDRGGSARTDIFFVDVQRFDRRYSQSQMSGGGGGGGSQQDEISRRQREIIVSTWNLIREQSEERTDDVRYVPDNAALLSRLQETLRGQAVTLAQRTRARMLAASDPKIEEFVENLEKAAEAMVPASALLAEIDLDAAILPEQEALQHLLRAEAVFNEINVTTQANNRGGGGGGSAGRDLSDMFELEMDLEKNQYETGSQATPDAPQQALDDIGNELEELARRQEQLADRMRADRQPTPAQRWQQDMLRRETEELRERLERMQQQQASSQSQPSSGGQGGQQSASGEPQQGGSESAGQEGGERQLDQLRQRMDQALQAMNDADQAMRQGADSETSRAAAENAQRQLEGARDQAAAERDRLLAGDMDALSERAQGTYRRQAGIEERLQRAIRDMLADEGNDDRLSSGLTFREEMEMAAEKRELQSELQRLELDARRMADRLDEDEPRAAEEIGRALDELREDETGARLAVAADYIEIGEAVYVSGSESAVTQSLRDFSEALARAGRMASDGTTPAGVGEEPGIAETLATTRELRRQLEQIGNGTDREMQPTGSGRDIRTPTTGVRVADIDLTRDIERGIDALSDEVYNQFRELRESGVSPRAIDELRRLAADVRASDFSGNEALLEREAEAVLGLVEQLELALARAAEAGSGAVRATPTEQVPDDHVKPVATYFRRLGEGGDARE